ncbi:GrpB family protein [Nocardia aurea]|uniref:GrpB family protein n=1 Tax=Nocardia aurea TaxID=2144174 RepID=A0ABV3FZ69_9NOCA
MNPRALDRFGARPRSSGPDRHASVVGWRFVPPEPAGRPWRRFFVEPDTTGQHRIAHLHLIASGHRRWGEQIAFRDALRRDGTLAEAYGQLERRPADRHEDDREAYTNAKAGFIAKTLGLAPG